jgi:hypothetical protein
MRVETPAAVQGNLTGDELVDALVVQSFGESGLRQRFAGGRYQRGPESVTTMAVFMSHDS